MAEVVFIGDEWTASAYRLGGVRTVIATPDQTAAVLDEQAGGTSVALILLAAPNAEALGIADLTDRIRRARPPMIVVGDIAGRTAAPDFSSLLKGRLGVAR